MELRTERLILCQWRQDDREPFARMNADPEVMRFFPGTLSREQSDAFVDRIENHFAQHGYGLWAVEVPRVTPFAGYVGLAAYDFPTHFTPAVETRWSPSRSRSTWRRSASWRSWACPATPADDFDHPNVPVGHPYRRHVLYRISPA